MKVLFLSEDKLILENNSPSQRRIVEYYSLVDMLFVIVTAGSKKEKYEKTGQRLMEKIWLYSTKKSLTLFKIFDIFKLASFQIKNKGIFQADLIVCEDQFISTLAGYLLSIRYKKPLYVFVSEINSRNFFGQINFKKFFVSKILCFILSRANCIKVDSQTIKNQLLKKSVKFKIEIIKPFFDIKTFIDDSQPKERENTEKKKSLLKSKFGVVRSTAITFVNNQEEVREVIQILKEINSYSSQISLILIYSENLNKNSASSYISKELKEFVYIEQLNNNFIDYLISSNIFWGVSSGGKYEEVLAKACSTGTAIVAKVDEVSSKFIEDGVTGYLCPSDNKEEMVNYFVDRNLYLIKNNNICISFKINIAISFKQRFGNTNVKENYLRILRASWETCIKKYKESKTKLYY